VFELDFTPTNALWLNRIERHFGPFKEFALRNSDHRSRAEQERIIMSCLGWRDRQRTIAIQPLPKAPNRAA